MTMLLLLIIIGVILALVPMEATIRQVLIIVVVIFAIVWLVRALGVVDWTL